MVLSEDSSDEVDRRGDDPDHDDDGEPFWRPEDRESKHGNLISAVRREVVGGHDDQAEDGDGG